MGRHGADAKRVFDEVCLPERLPFGSRSTVNVQRTKLLKFEQRGVVYPDLEQRLKRFSGRDSQSDFGLNVIKEFVDIALGRALC